MPTILHQIEFKEAFLPLVEHFNCAEADPPTIWEDEINKWIHMNPQLEDGALYWMTKGNQVWLYTTEQNEIVGYGSLGPSKWPDPTMTPPAKRSKRVPITLIPAVGVNKRFHGCPRDADKKERYSFLILQHLISEARKHTERQPFLGLYVHPENVKAIGLYDRAEFKPFSMRYFHEEAGVEYQSMILKLAT